MSIEPLRVMALGGLGEIGMNLMAMECGQDIILIDCGVLFPDLYWLGLDLVLPDFSWLIENQSRIRGLVVTHGHEDHIGAIPFLLKKIKIPIVYCNRFAARLISDKCAEHGVSEKLLTYDVRAGDRYDLGCFNVEFIHVTHSTLETFALAIETPHGLVVHSGDFKFDEKPYQGPPSDKKRFKELAKQKPLLLLSDSTNSERAGYSQSESSIHDDLSDLVKEAKGAVVVALFASNIHRVKQLVDIAERFGRKVFLSGRSMERYVHIAIEENYLPIKLSLLQPIESIEKYNRNEILVLSTGSQGEARSSLLRLSKNENRWLKILPDDVVILSSRNIPGNEKAISAVLNQLYRLGATVHYEDMQNVHVSGHAYQEEQLDLLKFVKPRYFIPVHGEYRHLSVHGRTAEASKIPEDVFVMENGSIWEFDGTDAKILDSVIPTGRRWVFREFDGSLEDVSIKERKAAARAGVIVISCMVTKRGQELTQTPVAQLTGFLSDEKRNHEMKAEIEKSAAFAFESWRADNPDGMTREQAIAISARKVVKKNLDLKPLVVVNLINV
jgi:ribonuclease J